MVQEMSDLPTPLGNHGPAMRSRASELHPVSAHTGGLSLGPVRPSGADMGWQPRPGGLRRFVRSVNTTASPIDRAGSVDPDLLTPAQPGWPEPLRLESFLALPIQLFE